MSVLEKSISFTLVLALSIITGCATTASVDEDLAAQANNFSYGKDIALQPYFRRTFIEGEWNSVLNLQHLGLAAMEVGEYETAEKAFDSAIGRIEFIFADDDNAKQARSKFSEEKVKDFKGEPYERAMTYYYRGLLYLRVGDYQNARAMFLSAEFSDTMSESEEFQSDFALMNYLAAWSSWCDENTTMANDLFQRAVDAQPERFGNDGINLGNDFVGLIDVGVGPSKAGAGQYKEILVIKPSTLFVSVENVTGNGVTIMQQYASIGGDINFQATTRGGRPVQGILDGKAQFKDGMNVTGDFFITAGTTAALSSSYSGNSDMAGLGAAFALAGLLAKGIAASTTPAADLRDWEGLPAAIYLTPGRLHDSEMPEVRFSSSSFSGETYLGTSDGQTAFSARNGKCGISWGRTHPAANALAKLPPENMMEENRQARNGTFRSDLIGTFGIIAAPEPTPVTEESI